MNKSWIYEKINTYHMISNLPIRAYDINKNMLCECGKIKAPFSFLGGFDKAIFNSKKQFNNYKNQNNEYFISMYVDNSKGKFYVIVGPFMYHQLTYKEIKSMAQSKNIIDDNINNVIEYFSSLMKIKIDSLTYHYKYLAQLLEVTYSLLKNNTADIQEQQFIEKNKLEYREIDFYHHSYLVERQFLNHFFKGRLTELERKNMSSIEPGLISEDYTRNTKNLCIVTITLIERYAIEHGMDAHTSFTIGDAYLRKIEKSNNISDIRVFFEQSLDVYSEAIKKANEIKYSKKINETKNFIDHNLSMSFSVQDIADYTKTHPTYLSYLFKKEIGMTITQYILNEKISEAKSLLDFSNHTLQEVSDILNFSSKSYFIHCFKKVVGVTPTVYRNR